MHPQLMKMHGIGNSMLVVAVPPEQVKVWAQSASLLCSPAFGIGSDGLMIVVLGTKNPIEVVMVNPDGSPMGMCGNGIRCVAQFVHDQLGILPASKGSYDFSISGRRVSCTLVAGTDKVRVNMGAPIFDSQAIPISRTSPVLNQVITVGREQFVFSAVSMGNPHCVVFVDSRPGDLVREFGPLLEIHPDFPSRTNVSFVRILSPSKIELAVWERGAGLTLACGTAACASVVLGVHTGRTEREVEVSLPGGDLYVEYPQDNAEVFMTGPARAVAHIMLTSPLPFQSEVIEIHQRSALSTE